MQFAGDKSWFLKAGADAPETLLAYKDFDGTLAHKPGKVPLKTYAKHVADWKEGDPSWKGGKGKGLIGAINYLAREGMNAFSFLPYNAGGDGDNAINLLLKMARALDDQSIPEENRFFVAPPAFYEVLFSAGSKFAEVQVTGDQTSPLRNGLVMQGMIAGFACYKSTALNDAGTDIITLSGLGSGEFALLAGHMSSTATASHIAKTEVVRSTETFSDIVRGLHVFGRKVLRPEALVRGVVTFA